MKKKPTPEADEFLENPEDIDASKPDTPEETADGIFLQGLTGSTWKGKKLEPFSFMRRRAANALGVRFGTLGEDEVKALEKDGFYKGIDTDVILILFICSLPLSAVLRAMRLPEQAYEKAMAFGEKEEIEPGTPEFSAAVQFMISEFVAIAKTKGNYEPADGKEKGSGKKAKPRGK